MLSNQQIANRIKQLAKAQGIPLKVMLSDLHMGINTISQLSNRQNISLDVINPIAQYLGCTADYLFGYTDDSAPKKEQPAQSGPALEALSSAEIQLLSLYRELNTEGKKKVQDFVQDLIDTGKYKKYNPSDFEINA